MLNLVSDGEDDLDDKKDHIGKDDNDETPRLLNMFTLVGDGEDDLDDNGDYLGEDDNDEVMMNWVMKIMTR